MRLIDIFIKIADKTLPDNYKFKIKNYDNCIFSVSYSGYIMWKYNNGYSHEKYWTCLSRDLFNLEVEKIK